MKILIVIIGIAIGYFIYTKMKKDESLEMIVKKSFPKYLIINKFGTVMICEINHRNEPDELIFIKTGRPKSIKKEGRRIIATYPVKPTSKELKNDLIQYLK
ncbi:hypothetical protein EXE30_05250 [Acinetobacter halotolerans]|uniref:Uncharacterized protein n=1 Tax=Acinetobacter halotolerans TaxID=1752076 RepID=A0A4Q6XIS5_9GAMM|nr:hypothetical protein EXE30_05250 [Acinetobacter halotolerans]